MKKKQSPVMNLWQSSNGNDVQAEAKSETAIEAKEADDYEKTV